LRATQGNAPAGAAPGAASGPFLHGGRGPAVPDRGAPPV